jgi:hypothetical protein
LSRREQAARLYAKRRGCAAAVANALPIVTESADLRLESDYGAGVVDRLAREEAGLIRPERHGIRLGVDRSGNDVLLTPHRGGVLITSDSGVGKSTIATALGTIFPDFDNLARPIKRRINHAAVAALPISFRPALLASISRTIANPTILNVVRDDTILRGRRASSACARQPVSKLKQRGEATKRENIRAYILTYHGFFDSESDILKPRWLPTCGSTCLKCRDRGKLKK